MATRSKSSKSSSRSSRNGMSNCALIIAAVLAFLLAASVGVLIWKMLGLEQQFEGMSKLCDGRERKGENGEETWEVWDIYPGFFRTPQMQQAMANLRHVNLNTTATKPPRTCNFECAAEPTTAAPVNLFQPIPGRTRTTTGPSSDSNVPGRFQPRRDPGPQQVGGPFSDYIHHSCCDSGRRYITPEKARSLTNLEVEVVQEESRKQYFLEESCDQDPRCGGCYCSQPEPFIYQAVVYKDKAAKNPVERYRIESIKLPGSCKCMNA